MSNLCIECLHLFEDERVWRCYPYSTDTAFIISAMHMRVYGYSIKEFQYKDGKPNVLPSQLQRQAWTGQSSLTRLQHRCAATWNSHITYFLAIKTLRLKAGLSSRVDQHSRQGQRAKGQGDQHMRER